MYDINRTSKGAVVLKDIIDVIIDLASGSASIWSYHQAFEPTQLIEAKKAKKTA